MPGSPHHTRWAILGPLAMIFAKEILMTPLDKPLRRALDIDGTAYVLNVSSEGLKLTLKGKRKGLELAWSDLVSGDSALAVALQASVGQFQNKSTRH